VGVPTTFRQKTSPRPFVGSGRRPAFFVGRFIRHWQRSWWGGEARRRALCPEPTEGAFACAEATVGYNWDGPSFPYKQIGGQTSIYSIVSRRTAQEKAITWSLE